MIKVGDYLQHPESHWVTWKILKVKEHRDGIRISICDASNENFTYTDMSYKAFINLGYFVRSNSIKRNLPDWW